MIHVLAALARSSRTAMAKASNVILRSEALYVILRSEALNVILRSEAT